MCAARGPNRARALEAKVHPRKEGEADGLVGAGHGIALDMTNSS